MKKIIAFLCRPIIREIGVRVFGLALIVSVVTLVLAMSGYYVEVVRWGYVVSTSVYLLTMPYGVYDFYQYLKKQGKLPGQKETER